MADYSQEVVTFATHPQTGIARAYPFLPNPSEVSAFCDAVLEKFKLRATMAKPRDGKRGFYLARVMREVDERGRVSFSGDWRELP